MSLSLKYIISSDDDEDYELPSLSERIKELRKPQQIVEHAASNSREEAEFLKSPEKFYTPHISTKLNFSESSESEISQSECENTSEKFYTPHISMKLNFSATSESETEEYAHSNISKKMQSAPQPLALNFSLEEDSDSDEVFSNLSERVSKVNKVNMAGIENKENCDTEIKTHHKETSLKVVGRINSFRTPLPLIRKKYQNVDDDSDSEDSFSNFVERLRTPMSVNRKNYRKTTDSSSDGSFSSFVEKIRTPLSINRKKHDVGSESDSDDSFLNSNKKVQAFHTPKSQKKCRRESVLLPKIDEIQIEKDSHLKRSDTSISANVGESEKEFNVIFPAEVISSTFLRRRDVHTRNLYKFYNKKIFNYQLPDDMPLIYDGSLKTTAGLTLSSVKDGEFKSSIKLSSKLLNSFDRLKNTLLHEMCHAAVWVINKQRKVRHGPLWQIWASRCKLILPFVECPIRCHNYEISYSVWYSCPKCKWRKGRCKQVKKYQGAQCKRCEAPIIMTFA